jgi:hypothetical protein
MTSRTVETSPQFYSRIAGLLYLVIIVGGLFDEVFVREQLMVERDPAATASNILTHELLYRSGFAAGIIILLCALVLLFIFYRLFKRVNKDLALLMVYFNLLSIAIESVSLLAHFAPLIFLKDVSYLSALNQDQLHALAYIPLRLQSTGYDLSLTFFGFFCILNGFLIFKSTFLPRTIGVLMAIAGVCYPINSFVNFLAPQYSLFPYIVVPSFVGELSLCLWLLMKGINVTRWEGEVNVPPGGGALPSK